MQATINKLQEELKEKELVAAKQLEEKDLEIADLKKTKKEIVVEKSTTPPQETKSQLKRAFTQRQSLELKNSISSNTTNPP